MKLIGVSFVGDVVCISSNYIEHILKLNTFVILLFFYLMYHKLYSKTEI